MVPVCPDCALQIVIAEVLAAEERDADALADALIDYNMDEWLDGKLD